MILTLLGGGGFRVPLIFRALLSPTSQVTAREVRLVDPDPARLQVITKVLAAMADGHPTAPKITAYAEPEAALPGTQMIFSAIRVGGVAGRALDEQIAADHGVIAQETVGAAGLSYALRTLPVAMQLAKLIKRHAPAAWVINFTNPAGLITEAMQRVLGARVVGICDSPVGLLRRTLAAAGVAASAEVRPKYAGLNHLGWLTSVEVAGRDVLPDLLANPAAATSFLEGQLFGAEWLSALGAIPNEYLHFYYFADELLGGQPLRRGRELAQQQREFFAAAKTSDNPVALWEATLAERERGYFSSNRSVAAVRPDPSPPSEPPAASVISGGGYDQVALQIMAAVSADRPAELILNTANRGALTELDPAAVVEVCCRIDAEGVTPLPGAQLPLSARGLVSTIKQVERYLLEAAQTGSAAAAWQGFATHPLVASVPLGRRLLAAYQAAFPELGYLH